VPSVKKQQVSSITVVLWHESGRLPGQVSDVPARAKVEEANNSNRVLGEVMVTVGGADVSCFFSKLREYQIYSNVQ
jgi:hypothetical protein